MDTRKPYLEAICKITHNGQLYPHRVDLAFRILTERSASC